MSRIVQDPKIMVGQPIIEGTRITVALILRELGNGASVDDIIDQYPHLTRDDIAAAAAYASKVISGERLLAAE